MGTSRIIFNGGLLLLLLVQIASGQELGAGWSCEGEKRELCAPGLKCAYTRVFSGWRCSLPLGSNCTGGLPCSEGRCLLKYPYTNMENVCLLSHGDDCTGKSDMCVFPLVCNFFNKCRRRAGESCRWWDTWYGPPCGVTAFCNVTTGTCQCLHGVTTENANHTCMPNAGRVGARCGSDNSCDDPSATCNTTSMTCHCDPTFTPHWPDFSCRLAVGQNCPGPHNSSCDSTTLCDTDNVCKLRAIQNCTGALSNMCASGSECIDGVCRVKLGLNCSEYRYEHDNPCEPGTQCNTDVRIYKCNLGRHKYCGNYTEDMCQARAHFCDRVTGTCKLNLNWSCRNNNDCPAAATCRSRKCRCSMYDKSYVSSDYVCGLPKGAVGAKCGTTKDPKKGCSDKNAKCKNDTCECRSGYRADYNTATCEMEGPKCSIVAEDKVYTFFGVRLPAYLPCSFKMANFKCGGVQVEVFASKLYNDSMGTTFVSDVTVNVTSTNNDVTSTTTYTVSNDAIQAYRKANRTKDPKSGSWNKTCCTGNCPDDRKVKDSISTRVGNAIFKRRRLQITYKPIFSRRIRNYQRRENAAVQTSVPLLIECGHSDFEALESYPDALCGKPENTQENVDNYQKQLQLESKQELPNKFGYVPDEAFATPRLLDHAALRTQNVKHTDQKCQEVSDILTTNCTEVHEKMYNCSKLYDTEEWWPFTTMPGCVDHHMNPTELYLICIRAVCKVPQAHELSDVTCSTMQNASRCDDYAGTDYWKKWIKPDPFLTIKDIINMTNCA